MHITKIQIKSHPLYHDVTLRFQLPHRQPAADFIIFAGENGTGKTQLLKIIHEITKLEAPSSLKDSYIEISFNLKDNEANSLILLSDSFRDLYLENKNNLDVKLIKHKGDSEIYIHFPKSKTGFNKNKLTKDDVKAIQLSLGVILFDNTNTIKIAKLAAGNFKHSIIISEKSLKKDDTFLKRLVKSYLNDHQAMKGIVSQFGFIQNSQLIPKKRILNSREILRKDFQQYQKYLPPGVLLPDFMFSTNEAFRKIKSKLRLVIDYKNKSYFFTKNGVDKFKYFDLSAGEKRILSICNFVNSIPQSNGNLIMIDEPEIGLHPNWQKIIISIFNIFTPETQFIFASHSPYLIFDNSTLNKKIFINKSKNKKIKIATSLKDASLYETKEHIIFSAFNLRESLKTSTKVLLLVEGRTDEMILKKAVTIFNLKSQIDIQWIGTFDSDTMKEEFSGEDHLKTVLKTLKHNTNFIHRKICCLFDNDSNVETLKIKKNLYQYKFPVSENKLSSKGIESLLNLEQWPNKIEDYQNIKNYNEGKITKIEIRKMLLANDLLKLNKTKLSDIFNVIEKELQIIIKIFD